MSYDARIKQEALEKIEKTNDVEENDEKEMMSKIQMTRAMLVLALAEKSQKYFRSKITKSRGNCSLSSSS